MSSNLAIPDWIEGQAHPEVTHNDAIAALDAAITSKFDCNLTSGNVSVTAAQYRVAILFRAINVATGGRTVTLPQVEREFVLVECDSANTNTVDLIRGATTITMTPGRIYLVRTDGTANGLVARDVGGISEPNDLAMFFPGVMTNAQLLFSGKATHAFTLPINLTGSFIYCGVAVTASTTITLKKNGTSIGTAVIASGTTGTFTFSAAVSFAAGDTYSVHGPATADATGADFSLDLKGTR